jgi:hypothetical protein
MEAQKKSLSSIAWNVSEKEYRADPALSYSTLAKFEREGFSNLDKLFDKVESPSLLFGSVVDCLITEGEQSFQDQYVIIDMPSLKPSVEPIVKRIYELFHNSYTNINDIPDSDLLPSIIAYNYQPNWKEQTRCKVIRQEGQQYYQAMFMAKDKTIVSQNVYNKAFACVRALKDSPATKLYFADNDPFSNIERYYQLKFRGTLNNIDYRCMADLILVDHKNKVVYPCDLKTSSHKEYEFPLSFTQWMYMIQGRLYWRLIRKAMDEDEYYKDFDLASYRFIVVNNKENPTPLVWEFEQTKTRGDLEIGGTIFRDPEDIGKELSYYLQNHPNVPLNIKNNDINSIEQWFNNKK